MNPLDDTHLHAWFDGELNEEDARGVAAAVALDPEAQARVAAWRAQRDGLHRLYDPLLSAPHGLVVPTRHAFGRAWGREFRTWLQPRGLVGALVLLAVGITSGWLAHDVLPAHTDPARSFAQAAVIAHAAFVPEVRHPVEVTADQEAHLVAWLSKRLAAPIKVPHLGDAGWTLLGGRLLPAEAGPMAQFMYQDANGRRLTLLVTRGQPGTASPVPDKDGKPLPAVAFRHDQRNGVGVFYWVDGDFAYALSAEIPQTELLSLADRVDQQLERPAEH